ncbi:hypothetical protein LCGC14_1865800 [marine sediment metagenome]|uniref:Uncharacterized protein n=2 Tax=root TaxID=1 RepID=A0A831QLX2_9FLAO|nr:hypothetical protein [Pricia antarctica]
MKKIFCFNNGGSDAWYTAMAMAEDGTCIATHVCSHESFMKHDLGITSDWKYNLYNKHYGEGNWELEWVCNPKMHKGLKLAYKRNQEMWAKEGK